MYIYICIYTNRNIHNSSLLLVRIRFNLYIYIHILDTPSFTFWPWLPTKKYYENIVFLLSFWNSYY